jgi:hypothetical protein
MNLRERNWCLSPFFSILLSRESLRRVIFANWKFRIVNAA